MRGSGTLGRVRIDFRREEIIHTVARRAVHNVIGRMLVTPSGAKISFLRNLKNGVHLEKAVRVNGRQRHRIARKSLRIDASACVRSSQVEVDRFVIDNFGSRRVATQWVAVAVNQCWQQQTVVGIIVIDAGGSGRSAGDHGEQPRKRVGRFRA